MGEGGRDGSGWVPGKVRSSQWKRGSGRLVEKIYSQGKKKFRERMRGATVGGEDERREDIEKERDSKRLSQKTSTEKRKCKTMKWGTLF